MKITLYIYKYIKKLMKPIAKYSSNYEEHLIMEGNDSKNIILHFILHEGCHYRNKSDINIPEVFNY